MLSSPVGTNGGGVSLALGNCPAICYSGVMYKHHKHVKRRSFAAVAALFLAASVPLLAQAQAVTTLGEALGSEAVGDSIIGKTAKDSAAAKTTQTLSTLGAPKALDNVPPNFKIGSRFSRSLQKYSGVNLITEFVASRAASVVIHRKVGGKVHVKVKTYSLTDLMAGKVKSVKVDVKDPSLKGVDLGEVTLASQNPIWFGRRGLKVPAALKVRASLSQKQIARALNSPEVVAQMQGLKLDMPGLGEQQLQIINPKVEILDDLLTLEAVLVTKGGALSSGLPLKISARPKLVGESRVVLEDLKVEGPDIVEPEKFAQFAQALLNPLVDFSRFDRRDHAFRMACLKVARGGVAGDGTLLLVPRAQAGGSQVASSPSKSITK